MEVKPGDTFEDKDGTQYFITDSDDMICPLKVVNITEAFTVSMTQKQADEFCKKLIPKDFAIYPM